MHVASANTMVPMHVNVSVWYQLVGYIVLYIYFVILHVDTTELGVFSCEFVYIILCVAY